MAGVWIVGDISVLRGSPRLLLARLSHEILKHGK